MPQIVIDIEFIKLVSALRTSQKRYAKDKGAALLAKCRQLEHQVDVYLDHLLRSVVQAEYEQVADNAQGGLL